MLHRAGWCNGSTPGVARGNSGSNPDPATNYHLSFLIRTIPKLTSEKIPSMVPIVPSSAPWYIGSQSVNKATITSHIAFNKSIKVVFSYVR